MFFNKNKKLAFITMPKCASISVAAFLLPNQFKKLSHSKLVNHHHIKYLDAVNLYPNLVNYKKYAVFRNPLTKFVSAANHVRNITLPNNYDYFAKNISSFKGFEGTLFAPQVEFLKESNSSLIDFDNLKNQIAEVFEFDPNGLDFPYLNKTTVERPAISSYVESFVRDYYAADYAFAKDILGREY
jgi:hypothetical protein